MRFLFALEFERTIGDNHVFFGAIGAMVMRRAPVVRRVPLFRVKRSAVKVIFKNEIPAAKVRRRGSKSNRGERNEARNDVIFFHIQFQSSPTTSAKKFATTKKQNKKAAGNINIPTALQ